MTSEDNKGLVRRFWEEVFNQQLLERAGEYVAQDYLDHGAVPGQGLGLEGAKRQRWARYFAAIPDLHAQVDDMVAEGDRVSVRFTVTGTQVGELVGIPPSGRRFDVGGMCIYRIADGKIAEQWEQVDWLGVMRQLGAIPAPAQQPA
jgi:steroid delta-isomerase-like uncharacterized protein